MYTLIIFSVALLFGIVFTFFAVKLNLQEIPENYVELQATITKIDVTEPESGFHDADEIRTTEYRVFVEYTYNGKTYSNVEYTGYDSSMKKGGSVLLYVNPDNPAEFIGDPSGNFVFLIVGAVVILVGLGGIGYTVYQRKKDNS